jgi:ABC-type polysaccharide/polyol phosphate transport system ATPase subunit
VVVVEVENVSKRFRRQTVQPSTTLKTALVDLVRRRRRPGEEATFHALKGVTFSVQQGQTLGIIGRNGSGKSTLLKLLAGIYRADGGRINVHGAVGALLELGAGFHPEFSGRENVLINGIVLGLSKREVRRRFDDIVRFAELEAFIDEPVKTYSSGMYMRLGFSVAVHANLDILLIDEILAVGDEAFQQKCYEKIAEFQRQQKTIILVSHDLAAVGRWSDEAIWLEEGEIREQGASRKVIDRYHGSMAMQEAMPTVAEPHRIKHQGREARTSQGPNRWGSQEIEIVSVRMADATGHERSVYHSGEQMRIALRYKVHRSVAEPVFGLAIIRGDGLWCYGSNTAIEDVRLPPLGDEGIVEVLLERLDFLAETYYLNVAVHARDGYPYDYHHCLYSFTVKSDRREIGVCRIPHRWAITPLGSVPHESRVSE